MYKSEVLFEKIMNRKRDLLYNLSWHLNYPLIPPGTLTFVLTYRCNLKCKYCYDVNSPKINSEMTYDEIIEMLKNAKKLKIKCFNIHGGELFLRKDIINILKFSQENEMVTAITTNGTLLDEKICTELVSICRNNKMAIAISLDGSNRIENDRVRGESYNKIIKSIKCLLNEREKQNKKILIEINTVISKNNLGNFNGLMQLCKDLKVDLIQWLSCFVGSTNLQSMLENDLFIRPEDFQLLDSEINFLIKCKKENLYVEIANDIVSLNNFKRYYRNQYYQNEKYIKNFKKH